MLDLIFSGAACIHKARQHKSDDPLCNGKHRECVMVPAMVESALVLSSAFEILVAHAGGRGVFDKGVNEARHQCDSGQRDAL